MHRSFVAKGGSRPPILVDHTQTAIDIARAREGLLEDRILLLHLAGTKFRICHGHGAANREVATRARNRLDAGAEVIRLWTAGVSRIRGCNSRLAIT